MSRVWSPLLSVQFLLKMKIEQDNALKPTHNKNPHLYNG